MRALKVYGWVGFLSIKQRDRLRPGLSVGFQKRCIVAALSKAAAARAAGYERPTQMFNLCETGNAEEIAAATARLGVVLVEYRHLVTEYPELGES